MDKHSELGALIALIDFVLLFVLRMAERQKLHQLNVNGVEFSFAALVEDMRPVSALVTATGLVAPRNRLRMVMCSFTLLESLALNLMDRSLSIGSLCKRC